MSDFVTAKVFPGKTNALVKNLMKVTGIKDPNEAVDSFNRGEWALTRISLDLLILVTPVITPTTTIPFVAGEKFVVNTAADAQVKISYIGRNFSENFLSKVEKPFLASTLKIARLSENATSRSIVKEIGGIVWAETTLTEMWARMEAQGHGQAGTLLTNGLSNIFFIRDSKGAYFTVRCLWQNDGWDCGAISDGNLSRWNAGSLVFFRNFPPK